MIVCDERNTSYVIASTCSINKHPIYTTFFCAAQQLLRNKVKKMPKRVVLKMLGVERDRFKLAHNLSHYRPTCETPPKWRFAGGPILAHLYCYLRFGSCNNTGLLSFLLTPNKWERSGSVVECLTRDRRAARPKGRGFEPHRRHSVVVLEQDTFILA